MKVLKSYVQTVEIYLVDAETGNDSPSNLKHVFETHLIGKQYWYNFKLFFLRGILEFLETGEIQMMFYNFKFSLLPYYILGIYK